MKTYLTFIKESEETRKKIINRALSIIKQNPNDSDKKIIMANLIRSVSNSQHTPFTKNIDYPGRRASRRDKHLEPTDRLSAEERKNNPETKTKNPKKLRKQKALQEID